MTDEQKSLVAFGGDIEVKHLGGTLWELKGALVLFGNEAERDFDKDYFVSDADYDLNDNGEGESSVYFNHGQDAVIGKSRIGVGKAKLTKDGRAIWIKHHLDAAKEYDSMVLELIEKRKAEHGKNWGWSSGVPGHLVERENTGLGRKVVRWPVEKDASITLIPNDWRHTLLDVNQIERTNVKSLLQPEAQTPEEPQPGSVGAASDGAHGLTENKSMEVQVMAEQTTQQDGNPSPAEYNALKAELDALKAQGAATSDAINKALKYMEDSPLIRQSGYYTVDGGTADPNVKSAGDLLLSIARKDVKRLVSVYGVEVKAHTERDGTTGGFYIPESTLQNVLPDLSLVSGIGNLVRRVPVSTPDGSIPMRDYSRSVTASVGESSSASGIASQLRAESGAYTEEQMYFEKVRWSVSDYASGYVKASRELVKDLPMIEALLRAGIEEDVKNKEEFAILRGSGAGQPLGVLTWAGTIEVTEDTDNTFAVADMDEMVSRHLVSDASKTAWVYHHGAYPNVAGMERGNGNAVMHNVSGALSKYLNGYLQFMSQHLPAQGTTGYVTLGDWSKYFLFEFGGLYIEMSEHADFLNGNVVWRFGKRQDGRPIMTAAVTLADNSFTVSPFVKLKNKT